MNAAPTGPLFVSPPVEPAVDWLRLLPVLVALPAAAILVWGLVRGRLPPAAAVAGLVLPAAAYGLGMLMVMEKSKDVRFCGSCHVMTPVVESLGATDGSSLAAIHYTRGLVPTGEACYTCHSGYGIWGTFDAKKAGVMHMLRTVTGRYDAAARAARHVRHRLVSRLPRGRGELPRRGGAPGSRASGGAPGPHDDVHRGVPPGGASRGGAHRRQGDIMIRAACVLALIALAILIAGRGASRWRDRHPLFLRRHPGAGRRDGALRGPALAGRRLPPDGHLPSLDALMRKESSMRYAITLMAALPLCVASISLAADGAALFKQNCASCHGATGQADTPAGKSLKVPALAGDAKVAAMSDADVIAAIKGEREARGGPEEAERRRRRRGRRLREGTGRSQVGPPCRVRR